MNRSMYTLFALVALAGCQPQEKTPAHETFTIMNADSHRNIPTIAYGATSKPICTGGTYGWLKFEAKAGDNVDIWVKAQDGGDAVVFLLDDHLGNVGSNDDADATTLDAHLVKPIAVSGTYYIGFRDYGFNDATFTVSLKGSGLYDCQTDSDCVAVPRVECCPHGVKEAVNVNEVDAYKETNTCTIPKPFCTQIWIDDSRVAQCDRSVNRCVMIAPTDIVCGGFANFHQCPAGFSCQPEGPGADRFGKCVASN
jgi:hypothetical protein